MLLLMMLLLPFSVAAQEKGTVKTQMNRIEAAYGVYFVYDTAYVYYHAAAERVAYFRPGAETQDEASVTPPKGYAAWLHLDDTPIDYPVMQGENNSEYLNKDPYGDYSLAGSIFLDSRNARDFSDDYSLVYGHHMTGDYMFGALDRFFDETYFYAHRTGTLTVGRTQYELELSALLLTDAREDSIFEPQGSEAVLALARECATYYFTPAPGRVLALSTCKEPGSTGRTVLLLTIKGNEEGDGNGEKELDRGLLGGLSAADVRRHCFGGLLFPASH